MSTFSTLTSISGQTLQVRANNKARTFTIKKNGTTYRTTAMSRAEFEENEFNTANDWASFLQNGSYYKVK